MSITILGFDLNEAILMLGLHDISPRIFNWQELRHQVNLIRNVADKVFLVSENGQH